MTVSDPFPPSSFNSIANAGGDGWSCGISELVLTCTRSDVLAAETSYPPILVEGTVAESAARDDFQHRHVFGWRLGRALASDGGG